MDYYSEIKKNELLIHIIVGMNLKHIFQSKRRENQKATYCKISFL